MSWFQVHWVFEFWRREKFCEAKATHFLYHEGAHTQKLSLGKRLDKRLKLSTEVEICSNNILGDAGLRFWKFQVLFWSLSWVVSTHLYKTEVYQVVLMSSVHCKSSPLKCEYIRRATKCIGALDLKYQRSGDAKSGKFQTTMEGTGKCC